jgi:hypothetical protein
MPIADMQAASLRHDSILGHRADRICDGTVHRLSIRHTLLVLRRLPHRLPATSALHAGRRRPRLPRDRRGRVPRDVHGAVGEQEVLAEDGAELDRQGAARSVRLPACLPARTMLDGRLTAACTSR